MLTTKVALVSPTGAQLTLGEPMGVPGYTLETFRIDPAPMTLVKRDLPAVTGGVVLPGRRDVRTVDIAGVILARTMVEANAMRRAVSDMFSDHGKNPIRILFTPEAVELELRGFTDGAPQFSDIGGNFVRFEVSIVCPDPVAVSTTVQSVTVPVGGATVSAANFGNAEVWPTITVTTSGPLTGITISNAAAGGKSLVLTGLAVDAGQQIVITTAPGRESIKAAGVSVMDKRTNSSRFWSIKPGTNVLSASYTGSGSAPSINVEFQEGWVS